MNAQDIYTLLIGYGIFCVGVYAFAMWTIRKLAVQLDLAPATNIPLWLWFYAGLVALCPIINIVMLTNTIKVRKANGNL